MILINYIQETELRIRSQILWVINVNRCPLSQKRGLKITNGYSDKSMNNINKIEYSILYSKLKYLLLGTLHISACTGIKHRISEIPLYKHCNFWI